MKKYFIILILLLLYSVESFSQSTSLEKKMIKINVISPGFSFEKCLSKNESINFDANFSFGFAMKNDNTSNINSDIKILASPFLRSQYRYYYNLQRRVNKGKSIRNNTGSFLAVNGSYYFDPINNQDYVSNYDGFTFGGVWGFQKTYKSNLNISSNVGFGYSFSDSNEKRKQLLPILNFTLSWVIGK